MAEPSPAGAPPPAPGQPRAATVDAGRLRPAWAEIDLDAIRHNAGVLATTAAPATVCAVVKAGGYGHGALAVANAALEAGATSLAVALVDEGRELREAGVEAPILLLSEPAAAGMADVVRAGLTPTIYTGHGLDALSAAARSVGASVDVHVKVDTGMHRVGAAPDEAVELALEVARRPEVRLAGFFTHLAVADEVDDPYTAEQLDRFEAALTALGAAGVRPPVVHTGNSAAALWHPTARYDMVRCGIAVYGLAPTPSEAGRGAAADLRPALALKARVSYVKEVDAGERLSYGLRYRLEERSVIATVPLGYADGVPRSLGAAGGEVLVGGRRRPIAGTVTMDQLLVDCGPARDGAGVKAGDEVVLLGRQGDEVIGAWEWAERTGTIAYEITCGLSSRVPRTYVGWTP